MSRLTRLLNSNLRVKPVFNFRFLPSNSKYPTFATSTTEKVIDNVMVEERVHPDGAVSSVLQLRSTQEKYAEGKYEDLYRRKVLPEELSRNVVTLSCKSRAKAGVCDVYVVGTCHISKESCTEVQALISYLKPQVVFLELCSNRLGVLKRQKLKVPTMEEMVDMLMKNQNAFQILCWFLAKVFTELGFSPGAEFRVAYEEAMKYGGTVILGDRPINITLQRLSVKMTMWRKTKLLYNSFSSDIFSQLRADLKRMMKKMDNIDKLTLEEMVQEIIQEIGKELPTIMEKMSKEFPTTMEKMNKQFPFLVEPLVHERDRYMSSLLLRIASEHSSVVAVVGEWHLQGIKKHWQQPVEMIDLMQMPPKKPAVSAVKIIASLGVAAAGVAIISGIYL